MQIASIDNNMLIILLIQAALKQTDVQEKAPRERKSDPDPPGFSLPKSNNKSYCLIHRYDIFIEVVKGKSIKKFISSHPFYCFQRF